MKVDFLKCTYEKFKMMVLVIEFLISEVELPILLILLVNITKIYKIDFYYVPFQKYRNSEFHISTPYSVTSIQFKVGFIIFKVARITRVILKTTDNELSSKR